MRNMIKNVRLVTTTDYFKLDQYLKRNNRPHRKNARTHTNQIDNTFVCYQI